LPFFELLDSLIQRRLHSSLTFPTHTTSAEPYMVSDD
jgi:hypothetical protein